MDANLARGEQTGAAGDESPAQKQGEDQARGAAAQQVDARLSSRGKQIEVAGEDEGPSEEQQEDQARGAATQQVDARLAGEEQRTGADGDEGAKVEQQEEETGGNVKFGPYNSDPGLWRNIINQQVRAYWAKMGPELCQNKDVTLSASEQIYKQQRRFILKNTF